MFNKGDIIWTDRNNRKRENLRHPAIVWEEFVRPENDFYGIMLSHSRTGLGMKNIQMTIEHFEFFIPGQDPNRQLFVNQLFYKLDAWGPFFLVGKLSQAGLNFIQLNLTNIEPTVYSPNNLYG